MSEMKRRSRVFEIQTVPDKCRTNEHSNLFSSSLQTVVEMTSSKNIPTNTKQ